MKPWQILYRQNKSAIKTAVVERDSGIPDEVSPSLNSFYAHHVNDQEPLVGDETAKGVIGSDIWFFIAFDDPDNLVYEVVLGYTGDAEGADTETYSKEDLSAITGGFLFSHKFVLMGSYYPEVMIKWRDLDSQEQNAQKTMTNPPVSIGLVTATASPVDCMIDDLVTIEFDVPSEVDSTVIEWGDE